MPDDRPVENYSGEAASGNAAFPANSGRIPGIDIRFWEVLAVLGASIGFAILVAFVTGVVMAGFDPNRAKTLAKSETFALTVLGLSTLGMFVWTHIIIIMRRHLSWRDFGFQPIRPRMGIAAVCLGLLAVPVMALTGSAVQRILGRPVESPQLQFLAPDGFSWTIVVGMVLIGGLLAPLAEEILFRGLLFGWLRRFWRILPATLLSAAIFGLIHGIAPVIVAAFVVGLALAYAYERTGSLWTPTIIHATQNCVAMAVMFASLK